MNKNVKIYVVGYWGMVGFVIVCCLEVEGFLNIVYCILKEFDLWVQVEVVDFFCCECFDYVFVVVVKVGGILVNNIYWVDFLYDNLMIQNNLIYQFYVYGVEKLLFLGLFCIYLKLVLQFLKEEYLLMGLLEFINEFYVIVKIVGIKFCDVYCDQYNCNFILVMFINLYGFNDNYDLKIFYVLLVLICKFYQVKKEDEKIVMFWGIGKLLCEFMYVDDLVDVCFFLMEQYDELGFFNVGIGEDISICVLVDIIVVMVGFEGEIVYDLSKFDGIFCKLMDVSWFVMLGWKV